MSNAYNGIDISNWQRDLTDGSAAVPGLWRCYSGSCRNTYWQDCICTGSKTNWYDAPITARLVALLLQRHKK